MKNKIIGVLGIIAILVATIWHWEAADEQLKDLLFYLLLATFVGQNIWLTFIGKKKE
ncbi:hypothetical protein [Photobacterium profundum]|uniref:hypothetical protein n=1 Tax=Photobacterium TaxID=657 RepID=UPI000316BE84|nr:hypothetical protein [Photobacterium profundum]